VTGRLYGRGATETEAEVGSIRRHVRDVAGALSDAGAGGENARGLRAAVPALRIASREMLSWLDALPHVKCPPGMITLEALK